MISLFLKDIQYQLFKLQIKIGECTKGEAYNGKYSADDLLFKAQNDSWPPKVTQLEANKNFWRRYPDVLKSNVKAQKYFTKKELEEILPEGSEILASSDS